MGKFLRKLILAKKYCFQGGFKITFIFQYFDDIEYKTPGTVKKAFNMTAVIIIYP